MSLLKSLALGACLVVSASLVQAQASCSRPANAQSLESSVFSGVNSIRSQGARAALNQRSPLSQAAQAHACDMARNDFFSHTGSDGSNVQARVTRAGYRACVVAENIAWGYSDAQRVLSGWMNSAGHRRNMLHDRVRDVGIGVASGPRGPVWVLVVARNC